MSSKYSWLSSSKCYSRIEPVYDLQLSYHCINQVRSECSEGGTNEGQENIYIRRKHSKITPEELSERWWISVKQAQLTLKSTTTKFKRSTIMPIARRYRVDHIFQVKRVTYIVSSHAIQWMSDFSQFTEIDTYKYLRLRNILLRYTI